MNVRAHVFVSGQVQGVFFRSRTRRMARDKQVSGWIRNLPDGRVEAIFEGKKVVVEGLIEFCRKGPPFARVTGVEVFWEDYTGIVSSFQIRRLRTKK